MLVESIKVRLSLAIILALNSLAAAAASPDWASIGAGITYDRSSVNLDPKTGGRLIFNAPKTGMSIFHTDCDGYGASAPISAKGATQTLIFTQTKTAIKAGTVYGSFYDLICK